MLTEKNKQPQIDHTISDALEVNLPKQTNLNLSSAKPEILDQSLLPKNTEKVQEDKVATPSKIKEMMYGKIKSDFQKSKQNMNGAKSLKL